jgi:hypothetical protein
LRQIVPEKQREYTTQRQKKTKKQGATNSEEKADFAGVAARVEHEPTPGTPSSSSNVEDPRRRQARLENAERGLQAQTESKNSLAREDHVPSSGEARDQYFRR